MAIKSPFTITTKYPKFTTHVTIINFDTDKHPDIFNRKLANIMINKINSVAMEGR
ncbi:hypothetical protein [Pelosinus propionicus]|uniref:Uncharacterized protein n=1 Tax=Pelosinus propionicus DSM 13327 TaxID=1123291 RepID=A0A1I4NFM6_9FIRM|nr:hypothetical protein [Pelosinus propionicus]SFM14308.1 hypothetical protein SAMN04490355_10464 [Pelosinus propionicus DSM 13327]